MKRSSRLAATAARVALRQDSDSSDSIVAKPKIAKKSKNGAVSSSDKGPQAPPADIVPIEAENGDMSNEARLPRSFYEQECIPLCKALLGKVLCRRVQSTGQVLRGVIVETEAYPGNTDKASVSYQYQGRRTPRNEAMFMPPSTAYVYFTYGMYYCFNISSQGEGSACLIRAAEPLEDYEIMHTNRNKAKKSENKKRMQIYELANGPSKLCMAFDMSRDSCDKIDMASSSLLWLEESDDVKWSQRQFEISEGKRIGIDSCPPEARDRLWRFYVKDSWAESRAKLGELKKIKKQKEKEQKLENDAEENPAVD